MVGLEHLADFAHVSDFEAATKKVTKEDVENNVLLFEDMYELRRHIDAYLSLGIDRLVLHNINRTQEGFIEAFKKII